MDSPDAQKDGARSPRVSIIIPTCGRPVELRRCIEQLLSLRDNGETEILVSDDSPDIATLAEIRTEYPMIRWLRGPRRGPAANRNSAVEYALGQWLLFLDDDVVPAATCMGAYLDEMRRTDVLVLEGCTVTDADINTFSHEAPVNLTGGALPSCNFAIKRTVFQSLGGFRECFTHWMEDVDLNRRIAEAKVSRAFVQLAEVYHPARKRPGMMRLASRWKARVMYERIWGMPVVVMMLWLPWHIFRIRVAQYRISNGLAKCLVASVVEAALATVQLPWWLAVNAACLKRLNHVR